MSRQTIKRNIILMSIFSAVLMMTACSGTETNKRRETNNKAMVMDTEETTEHSITEERFNETTDEEIADIFRCGKFSQDMTEGYYMPPFPTGIIKTAPDSVKTDDELLEWTKRQMQQSSSKYEDGEFFEDDVCYAYEKINKYSSNDDDETSQYINSIPRNFRETAQGDIIYTGSTDAESILNNFGYMYDRNKKLTAHEVFDDESKPYISYERFELYIENTGANIKDDGECFHTAQDIVCYKLTYKWEVFLIDRETGKVTKEEPKMTRKVDLNDEMMIIDHTTGKAIYKK